MELSVLLTLLAAAIQSVKAQVSTAAPSASLGDQSDYPSCALVCSREANTPSCDLQNTTCVCGPEYRASTGACAYLSCTPAEYTKAELLGAQFCNPTYNNETASAVSAAIAEATANATAAVAGKDVTDRASYPPCSQKCTSQYLPATGCGSLANRTCVCQTSDFAEKGGRCELATCSPEDLQRTRALSYKLCAPVGGFTNGSNVSTTTSTQPVATFTGEGASMLRMGMGAIGLAVVGALVLGL